MYPRSVIDPVDSLIAAPVVPPMTVGYARRHIRSLTATEDGLIATWIQAAAQYFEGMTGRQIITATRESWMDAFPGYLGIGPADIIPLGAFWPQWGTTTRIELPRPPLQSVISVTYVDGTGVVQTVDDGGSPATPTYLVKAPQGPYARRGWIEPKVGTSWPLARYEGGAVRIQYICGYGDTVETVPALVTGILCYLVAHYDQHREAVHESRWAIEVPYGVQAMIEEFKYSAMPSHVARTGLWPAVWA